MTLQREQGSASQVAAVLSLFLPTSPYHHLLSKLPFPDQTNPTLTTTLDTQMAIHVQSLSILEEIISLLEQVERDAVDREVEKRRTRLDSASKSREALRNEIGVEIWRQSKVSLWLVFFSRRFKNFCDS